ncbi:class I SAM-dependent methyltransferase [Rhodococcoides kyotonense]|uniref:Methyltransferase domain-containing protein n=1 Tax=Rhodococcoides kyotonense TaxID=398843 RepID=A0A239JSG6_9NOCA|nr:methyltransferase domain-containing protein [Rhodococcus kyotonensis]SNT08886.1 Methyltransferase domain-containing protein [Rhodococcus kyotonensis]
MSESVDTVAADRALKSAHRSMWGMGDYPAIASEVVGELGPVLVHACSISPGQRVLDIAAGSGNASLAAAACGAHVVASDLTPELFTEGRRLAAERGLDDIEWTEADAEALPFADGEFDAVLSCIGVMFAPHHRVAADELTRVARPGASIGLVNWTPTGFIGRMFATMKPYAAPPPPGAQPPPLWGDEAHVRELFGDRVVDLEFSTNRLAIDMFERPADFLEFFKAKYGPTIAVYNRIGSEPDKVHALDEALKDEAEEVYRGGAMEWEYLLVTGRRAG